MSVEPSQDTPPLEDLRDIIPEDDDDNTSTISLSPRRWVRDDEAPTCAKCQGEFSLVTRRHHCRMCGNVFCSKCCDHFVLMQELGYEDEQRICDICLLRTRKWRPCEEADSCRKCKEHFSVFTRKHHCRMCGNIYCASCCNHFVMMEDLGYTDAQRVCDECLRKKNKWMPDEEALSCSECQAAFGVVLRKHHCRSCGKVFCWKCSNHCASLMNLGYEAEERVCTSCYTDKLREQVAQQEHEQMMKAHDEEGKKIVHVRYGATLYASLRR